MEKSNIQTVRDLEKRVDSVLNEVLKLNEKLFNADTYDLKNLPADYCASDETIQKAIASISLALLALKCQALLTDSSLLDNEEISTAKKGVLEALLSTPIHK